jgi:hypothetical protein
MSFAEIVFSINWRLVRKTSENVQERCHSF